MKSETEDSDAASKQKIAADKLSLKTRYEKKFHYFEKKC